MHRALSILPLFLLFISLSSSAQEAEDPLEGLNRFIHGFNEKADQWVVRPLAQGYAWVVPDPTERAVGRFFGNLGEVRNSVNHLLQGKLGSATNSGGRFLVNSTLGLAGFLDVAADLGLPAEDDEDIGQTLAVWGVGSGPYVVLPFLGPSTLRDAPSRWADRYLEPVTYLEDQASQNIARGVELLDIRAGLLNADQMSSSDRYAFMRDVWLQRREYLINDGQVEDDFSDGGFLDD